MALNPIAFTERVVDDFLHYQLTTYPLADVDLYQQLRGLLKLEQTRNTPLRKGPFVSLSRPFKDGGDGRELVRDGVFHPQMHAVVPYKRVRAHQEKAIRSVHTRPTPRSSPPAPARARPRPSSTHHQPLPRAAGRRHAPPGVVAVLVYPMNALAEDQLDRLRGAAGRPGIPFGMYVGKTPDEEARCAANGCRRARRTPTTSSG
jgi:hypothetical protein